MGLDIARAGDSTRLHSLFTELEGLERRASGPGNGPPLNLREWLALAEAWRIAQGLRQTGGNRAAAARLLGIGRRTLYRKIEKLGIRRAQRDAGGKERWPLPERL